MAACSSSCHHLQNDEREVINKETWHQACLVSFCLFDSKLAIFDSIAPFFDSKPYKIDSKRGTPTHNHEWRLNP
jgi:hypothetical protein